MWKQISIETFNTYFNSPIDESQSRIYKQNLPNCMPESYWFTFYGSHWFVGNSKGDKTTQEIRDRADTKYC